MGMIHSETLKGMACVIECLISVVVMWLKTVRYEVLTAILLRSQVFWDVTLCCPVSGSLHFEGPWPSVLLAPPASSLLPSLLEIIRSGC